MVSGYLNSRGPMINTSINLTPKAMSLWKRHHRQFKKNLPNYCWVLTRNEVRRDRAKRFNQPRGDYEKISVRWTEEEFNVLQYFSHSLRISVSYVVDILLRRYRGQAATEKNLPDCGNYHWTQQKSLNSSFTLSETWSRKQDPPRIRTAVS